MGRVHSRSSVSRTAHASVRSVRTWTTLAGLSCFVPDLSFTQSPWMMSCVSLGASCAPRGTHSIDGCDEGN